MCDDILGGVRRVSGGVIERGQSFCRLNRQQKELNEKIKIFNQGRYALPKNNKKELLTQNIANRQLEKIQ